MRESFRIALAVLVLVGLAAPGVLPAYDYSSQQENDVVLRITDDIDLTITGEIRTRFEWNRNLVDFTDDLDDEFGFVPSRARIGFKLDLPRDVVFYLEAQELFSFGEDTPARITEYQRQMPNRPITGGLIQNYPFDSGSIGEINTPGGSANNAVVRQNENARVSGAVITQTHRDDLGLYQAYIAANNIGGSAVGFKAGRSEYTFGNEWLMGNQDFYGGASFDGVDLSFTWDRKRLDLFWIKADERNTGSDVVNSTDDDTDMYGAYFTWPEVGTSLVGFDLYAMMVKSNFDRGPGGDGDGWHQTKMDSYWVGGRVFRKPEWGWHFNLELTGQFGTVDGRPDGSDSDIEAFGGEAMLGYTWDTTGSPDLHVGYTYATGDDDPTDDDMKTFAAPNPEIHPRLGFADLFLASNISAWQLGYAGAWENLAWGLEFYNFRMAESVLESGEKNMANEVDLWFSYQYSRHLTLQTAFAWVGVEKALEEQVKAFDYDPNDAYRFYVNLRLMI